MLTIVVLLQAVSSTKVSQAVYISVLYRASCSYEGDEGDNEGQEDRGFTSAKSHENYAGDCEMQCLSLRFIIFEFHQLSREYISNEVIRRNPVRKTIDSWTQIEFVEFVAYIVFVVF